jgi:hypothetical protein
MRSLMFAAVAALAFAATGSAYAAACGTPQHHCARALHPPSRKACLPGYTREGKYCLPPHAIGPTHRPAAPPP